MRALISTLLTAAVVAFSADARADDAEPKEAAGVGLLLTSLVAGRWVRVPTPAPRSPVVDVSVHAMMGAGSAGLGVSISGW